MKWFSNLRIRNKILLSSAMFIVIILIMAGQSYYNNTVNSAAFQELYNDRLIPIRRLNVLMINNLQRRINMLQEIIAYEEGDMAEVQRRIDYSKELVDENQGIWDNYMKTYITPEEKVLADDFWKQYNDDAKVADRFGAAINAGNIDRAKVLSDEWLKGYSSTRDALSKLIDYNQDRSEQMAQEERARAQVTQFVVLGLSIGALVLGIVITITLDRFVAVPIRNATERVKDIAEGEGDLTKRVEVNSNDEVGELAGWLNQFINKIHDIVADISENTQKVVTGAKSLTQSSQELSSGTEEMSTQAETIATAATQMAQNFETVSSSIEEMSISVSEVAKNSSEASNIADTARKSTEEADKLIQDLGASAKEIGVVIESIVSIANQTNLLALNASIEAAGAGEAGKGFAVVASEVKELARQAGTSSEDIKDRVGAVQKSSDVAVKSIGEINEVIARVSEISSSIASSVEEQSITAKEIARNINQASTAASEVTQNIEGVSVVAKQGAQNAETLSQLARDMNQLSEALSAIVGQFVIKQSAKAVTTDS